MDNLQRKTSSNKSTKTSTKKKSENKKVENKPEDIVSKCIEDVIQETQKRKKLYIVYDETLNKWKAIKEQGRRAIKMANTRTGLLKEINPLAKKENFEVVVLNKRDMKKRYNNETNKRTD